MALPSWSTLPNLGTYAETHSFSLDPLVISFAAEAGASVTVLNGALPAGLTYDRQGNTLVIIGESDGVITSETRSITWRITNPNGGIADRTYSITITPVINPPDWTGQDSFLGYAASGGTATYVVKAHTDSGQGIAYSFASFAPPTGMSIDSYTGVITYSAPVVAADQTVAFGVVATSAGSSSTLAVSVDLLTVPHAPAWITPAGLLAELIEGSFLDVVLETFESSGASVSYSLVSSSPSWPWTLDSTGLLFGSTPKLYVETTYQFTIAATSANGTTQRSFEIIASPVEAGELLHWTHLDPTLPVSADGRYVTIDVSAYSARGAVTHNITGGIVPGHLVLSAQSGLLVGFLEYQRRDREYYFNITATDGVETLTRRYVLPVTMSTQGQFMGMTIPLEGSLKDLYYNYVEELISTPWIPYNSTTPQGLLYTPYLQLIQGLNYSIDNPATAVGYANLHLNTTELMIGATSNANVVADGTVVFFNPVLDADAGAAATYMQVGGQLATTNNATVTITTGQVIFGSVYPSSSTSTITAGTLLRAYMPYDITRWMQGRVISFNGHSLRLQVTETNGSGTSSSWVFEPGDFYPASLTNIRNDLIAGLGWLNDGQGSGASLLPIVDLATGGISNVQVIYQGSGYLYGPEIAVVGTGNGAVISANITMLSATVISGGANWTAGTTITLSPPSGDPAIVTVSNVGIGNGITALEVSYGGDYDRFPYGPYTLTDPDDYTGNVIPATIQFSLGIGNVSVRSPGAGYTYAETTITTSGSEMLPEWQSAWSPAIKLGTVSSQYGDDVAGRNTAALQQSWYYQRWPLQHAIVQLQGIEWRGDTTFDGRQTSFDGGTTFWNEWLEPKDTIFEYDYTRFDQDNTQFDSNLLWGGIAYAAWGQTIFDEMFTIFDLYSTTFDESATPTQSITLLRKLLRITTQQISGHDVVV